MKVYKNKFFGVIFGLSFGLLILTGGIAYLRLAEITTPLIIHFDAYEGIDFLGNKFDVLKIMVVALVIFLINLALAEVLFERQKFLSFVLAYSSLAVSGLILIAVSVIISIN